MNPCYYYLCKYNTSNCRMISKKEYDQNEIQKQKIFQKDKNINKTHKICHQLNPFFNSFLIIINNK